MNNFHPTFERLLEILIEVVQGYEVVKYEDYRNYKGLFAFNQRKRIYAEILVIGDFDINVINERFMVSDVQVNSCFIDLENNPNILEIDFQK